MLSVSYHNTQIQVQSGSRLHTKDDITYRL